MKRSLYADDYTYRGNLAVGRSSGATTMAAIRLRHRRRTPRDDASFRREITEDAVSS